MGTARIPRPARASSAMRPAAIIGQKLAVVGFVLCKPGLGDALLHPRQPGLDDEIIELLAVEPCEVGDPNEYRGIVVEVWCREVDAAVVGEADLLLVEVAD